MKARTLIIMTGAILALSASVAPASGQPASVDTYDGSALCPDGTTLDDNCGYCPPSV